MGTLLARRSSRAGTGKLQMGNLGQNVFSGLQRFEIQNTTLADIIARNTDMKNLQQNVFVFNATIVGRVTQIAELNKLCQNGNGLGGITVELQDSSGNILDTTQTRADGSYSFDKLALGTYPVRVVVPDNLRQVTADPTDVDVTRGGLTGPVNFVLETLTSGLTGG